MKNTRPGREAIEAGRWNAKGLVLRVTKPEGCAECGRSKSEFVEGPVLRCLRCSKALCFLCTGPHLDSRNRCEEAK
jgi:hypothetical protein